MKILKIILVIFVLGGLIIAMFGCSAKSNTTAANQKATVTRGNLSVDITAAGNLALSHTEDLPVDLFYPSGAKGTIGEVLVKVGDSVKQGQVLVTIDKTEWDNELAAVEDEVTSANSSLLQSQISEKNAEQAVTTANETIIARQTAVLNAEIAYQQTQTALATAITAIDYQQALSELMKAQTWYDYVTTTFKDIASSQDEYDLTLQNAQDNLDVAQTNYNNVLAGYNSEEVNLKKNQVEVAQMNLDAARTAVDDANNNLAIEQMSLQLNQGSLKVAQNTLDNAQQNLTKAQAMSPEIVAPFDGFVTAVNVAGGDQVLNGTVAVTIADPNKFQANVLVNEMDITKVKVGGAATVTAAAISGSTFTANVTQISPTATIQSGVVNYAVTVELNEPNTVSQNQTTPTTENATSSALPPNLQRAVDSGRMTEEQAEEFMKNASSGNFTPPSGFSPSGNATLPGGFTPSGNMTFPQGTAPAFSSNQSQSQLMSAASSYAQLREGLTVTVNIIVASRTNVLLVPNGAVTTTGGQSYVQVVSASGTIEKRAVQTGLSDWEYTEITSGLSEGEQIIVSQAASSTTTPSSTTRPGGGGGGIFRIP